MKALLIIAIILLILFFPIHLKLDLCFKDNDLSLTVFRKKIAIYPKQKKKNKKNKSIKKQDNPSSVEKEASEKIGFSIYKYILKSFRNRMIDHFKIKLKIKLHINYDTDDAARTALLYPLFCQLITLFYALINIPFKTIKREADVKPIFKGNNMFEMQLHCILIFNLVKIIYIAIIFSISYLGGIKNGKSSNRKSNEINNGKS